jgi:DNA-binding transcriptional LysR family regulator
MTSAKILEAVLAGLGLAHAPAWLFTREIASGEVRRTAPSRR